jgi:hypothetical protein
MKIVPLDKSETEPDVNLIETWHNPDPNGIWNAATGWTRGVISGVSGNGWFITKNLIAAFETLVDGGALGKVSKYEQDRSNDLLNNL